MSKQYTYDDSGRLSVEQISGTVNRTSQYTYDKRGNRIGESVSGDENYTYINTYDNNNRLLTSLEDKGTMYEGVSYAYDNNGNRTLKKQVVAGDIYADTEAVKSKEHYSYTVTDKLKT